MKAVRLHSGIHELNKYAGPLDSCCYLTTSLEMDVTLDFDLQLRGPTQSIFVKL